MANPTSRQAAAETWHLWGHVNWQVSVGHCSTSLACTPFVCLCLVAVLVEQLKHGAVFASQLL